MSFRQVHMDDVPPIIFRALGGRIFGDGGRCWDGSGILAGQYPDEACEKMPRRVLDLPTQTRLRRWQRRLPLRRGQGYFVMAEAPKW